MADVLTRGNLFPETLVTEMINQVKGKSALANLCAATPIPFNGMKEFTFTFDKEVDVVAENGAKTKGGVTVSPVTIVPVKIEYGARISDEFDYASEEVQLDYLKAFAEGWAKKAARGLDLMAFHGINPRTGLASSVIGDNHFDKKVTQTVTITDSSTPDANMEDAIAMVQGSEFDVTGAAFSPAFRSSLAAMKTDDGRKLYPELAWGSNPGSINGLRVESNSTISANSSLDRALVGDFESCFKWGYAKQIPVEIIRYGNPDNDATLGDLKGHNQIYLRAEAYIGWGILSPAAFAWVKAGAGA
ncbi:MAG: phage major capsid protein [Candidatus Limivicinus sp.]|nr:phage major capsid protein [Candidatus Limivicinus sp.]